MNKLILNTVNQDFINKNLDSNIVSLLLKKADTVTVNTKELVEQIEAKKKCKTKLPTWFNASQIYYPNKLNIEQTSSEKAAQYKTTILKGDTIIDLTGGFGVDSFYFSKCFKHVTHCEIDNHLSEVVKHNFELLQTNNVTFASTNGIEYLKQSNKTFDCIYIDPSRRHDSKGKVFYLKDCLPDVVQHLDLFLKYSNIVLIKASPMLDLSIGLVELKWVKEIHVVAIQNEVKELLFLIENGYENKVSIKTINLNKNQTQFFEFYKLEEKTTISNYSLPKTYLYEPNVAILKAGAFNTLSKTFNIFKLHKHSHLYTSDQLIEFPGKCFKIIEVLPCSKKVILQRFSKTKANIITRNFPETVAQIRAKYKIKDGGDLFLFFTTNLNNIKIAIVTTQQ